MKTTKVITWQITLLEPTLVTALDGDPNSAAAFDYLPGSVLRGAIISKFIEAVKEKDPDYQLRADDPTVRQLFFAGKIRFLNGYLLEQGRRTLPAPQSWQQDKEAVARQTDVNRAPIYDFALDEPSEVSHPQGVRDPFCLLSERVRLVSPDRYLAVHTARTRRFGRAMPAESIQDDELMGAVYRYEALAAGQSFEAVILCEGEANEEIAARLFPLIPGEVVLGGSRSGGYGRVRFENAKYAPASWREISAELQPEIDGRLIITLLSDALLRDRNGQLTVSPEAVTAALSARLKVELHLQQAFMSGRAVGGFNRKWGLPLPQAMAMEMSSVLVYDAPACTPDQLQELETAGIGERRAEGFGRVAVNWQTTERLLVAGEPQRQPDWPKALSLTAGTPDAELAERMAQRMLRWQLDERVTKIANDRLMTQQSLEPIRPTQLSRLRNVIHDELMKESPDPQRVGNYLKQLRRTARTQFEQAQVGNQSLLKWLDETWPKTDAEQWSKLLEFKPEDLRKVKVGNIEAVLNDKLRAEYVLRLVDAMLARAAKVKRRPANQKARA